ncbi:cation transport protein-domain-containing protein [Lactifluus subvellereus]|nr:cation transport protein-domain-containing protein [Lactifluus subvellereus]
MTESNWVTLLRHELNFFRIHLIFFTLLPIISAGILSACNGSFDIKYIDSLFVCISGMTGTGLATVDLSALTPWQQVIIVFVSLVGSPVFVSLVLVYVRKQYFAKNLDLVVRSEFERTNTQDVTRGRTQSIQRSTSQDANDRSIHNTAPSRFLIRRVDTEPRQIPSTDFGGIPPSYALPDGSPIMRPGEGSNQYGIHRESPLASAVSIHQTSPERYLRPRLTRRGTVQTINPQYRDDSFGGFGSPLNWFIELLHRLFPSLKQNLHRTLTMPRARLFISEQGEVPPGARPVSYLSFNARVGHNSRFIGLSQDDYEELGGVEYRALIVLLWTVSGYYIVTLLIPFAVLAPYMSMAKWKDNFLPPNQHRVINPIWYSTFQIVGAWANTGFSLVDQNLVPFQTAYPLLMFMVWLALAGNTGFPIFLRFCIWVHYKLTPKRSKWRGTLHFLLDHPRRCFIYLFPSRQTWFLLTVLVILNFTDWFLFLVLNIGIPAFDAVPVGRRFILGLVQAVAVRFAGFQSIALSILAPALQVLYFVMMYVAPYPVAMSVRSTNVYEERSLGIFEEDDPDIENEADYATTDSRVAIWGRYLGRHVRRQLSFDMWWLALALFLICIAERGQLRDPENASWFTIFAVFFEIVSAYGTVGLSLGIPSRNYSLSGAMSKLSKLIICIVMLRGRHRGLPVALDRAIVFPTDFVHNASEKVKEIKMKRRIEAAATAGAVTALEQGEKLPPINEDVTL